MPEAGADFAINALTETYIGLPAGELAEETGRSAVPIIVDVTKPDGAKRAIEEVLETFGRIDVVVGIEIGPLKVRAATTGALIT